MRKLSLSFSSTEKLLFTIAQLHYEGRLTRTAIAGKLGISVTHVARLLRDAMEAGIVEISVKSPSNLSLESQLCSVFGLREARVITGGVDEASNRSHLGKEAAALLRQLAHSGSKVGIGSGRTMYELVKAVPERPLAVEVFPLALIADQWTEVRSVDAAALVTTLWFKLRPDAKAFKVGFSFPAVPFEDLASSVRASMNERFRAEFRERLSAGDLFFFSCSQVRKDSQILDLTRQQDVGLSQLRERGVVGDYLFRAITSQGTRVNIGLDEYVIGADLELLQGVSADRAKTVVLVAGGSEKAPVIAAGLKARLFNVLITDDTAASLLLQNRSTAVSEREVSPTEQSRLGVTHDDDTRRARSSVRASSQGTHIFR